MLGHFDFLDLVFMKDLEVKFPWFCSLVEKTTVRAREIDDILGFYEVTMCTTRKHFIRTRLKRNLDDKDSLLAWNDFLELSF